MSATVCVKDGDGLILATDSRFMGRDFRDVFSDQMEKIFELGPDTFLATSGWNLTSDFQQSKAQELAGNTSDICAIGKALERDTITCLTELAQMLAVHAYLPAVISTLTGQTPIHGCMLAGRSNGELGVVIHSYWLRGGRIENQVTEFFDNQRRGVFFTGGQIPGIAQDMSIWTDDPLRVVRRILSGLRSVNPQVGGEDQIVRIDSDGSHWISRLSAPRIPADQLATGTISALVQMISPVISGGASTGATLTLNLNGTTVTIDNAYDTRLLGYPGLKIANNTYPDRRICVVDDGLWGIDQNNTVRFQLFGDGTLHLFDAGGVERVTLDGVNGQVIVNGMGVKVNGTFINVP
jgi:hypothetical protein